MTADEKKTFEELKQLIKTLTESNRLLSESLNNRVSKLETQYRPVSLEQDILSTVQISIGNAINKVLTEYNSPLIILTKHVIESHSNELKKIINDSFTSVISTESFKQSIVEAFSHKVARTIIANNTSLFEKVSNELKQDQIFKAKIIAATAAVVEECLVERKNKQ